MKKKLLTLMVVLGVLTVSLPAWGISFINPPDDSFPTLPEWVKIDQQSDRIDYPGDVDRFQVTLSGNTSYRITLEVPWYADFDMKLYDENGNLVGSSTQGEGQTEVIYITPRWTGPFYIKVYSYDGDTGSYTIELWK